MKILIFSLATSFVIAPVSPVSLIKLSRSFYASIFCCVCLAYSSSAAFIVVSSSIILTLSSSIWWSFYSIVCSVSWILVSFSCIVLRTCSNCSLTFCVSYWFCFNSSEMMFLASAASTSSSRVVSFYYSASVNFRFSSPIILLVRFVYCSFSNLTFSIS